MVSSHLTLSKEANKCISPKCQTVNVLGYSAPAPSPSGIFPCVFMRSDDPMKDGV